MLALNYVAVSDTVVNNMATNKLGVRTLEKKTTTLFCFLQMNRELS